MNYRPLFPAWITDKDLDTILKSLISSRYLINEDIEIDITKDKVLSLIGIKSISDFDIIAKNQESASNFDWYINTVLEKLAVTPIIDKYKKVIQNPKEIYNFIDQFEDVEALAGRIILLNNGVFRLFFILTATVFAVIFYICIQKLLSPRINRAKNALDRLRHTRAGSFIVKYILK